MTLIHTLARRKLAKCPASLQKFGFCGLLAVIYAAKIAMPANIPQLLVLFAEVKRICGMQSGKWEKDVPKRQGRISFKHTLCLLRHYDACIFQVKQSIGDKSTRTTLCTWLRTQIAPHSNYIVHVHNHAFFVHVASNRRKWTILDQNGPCTRHDLVQLRKKGGFGRRLVSHIVEIHDKTAL